jgi:hypothetical protein
VFCNGAKYTDSPVSGQLLLCGLTICQAGSGEGNGD